MMMGKGIMINAKKAAEEMQKSGETIKQIKLGQNGQLYVSSDETLVKWVTSFEHNGAVFFVGAKK